MIYLDNASTTKVEQTLLDLFIRLNNESYANPSSIHSFGSNSARLFARANELLLSSLKCNDHEVIFTSCASESINLALKGYALRYPNRGKHIISTVNEHPAVIQTLEYLKTLGYEVTYLPVNSSGVISIEDLKNAIREDTILVSIIAVNNETGSINPVNEVAKYLKQYSKIAFHVDVTQALGKVELDYNLFDMFSFSGHKIHAFKSSGALIKRKKIELVPQIHGGGQQNNLRSGTNDLAIDACLAKATSIILNNLNESRKKVIELSNRLKEYLYINKDIYSVNSPNDASPFIVNFSLINKKASVVVEALSNKGIMVSSISACHSSKEAFSYVVNNMIHNESLAHNTIRVSFAYSNTLEEVETLIKELDIIVKEVKSND